MNKPVLWQYRWLNPSGRDEPESMLQWEPLIPRLGQTMESRIEEIRSYESDGKPQYEARALYAESPEQRDLIQTICNEVPHAIEAAKEVDWRGTTKRLEEWLEMAEKAGYVPQYNIPRTM